jgi:hypothetical protein
LSAVVPPGTHGPEGPSQSHLRLPAAVSPTPVEGVHSFQHMVGKLSKAGVGGISFSISSRQTGTARPHVSGVGGERPVKPSIVSNAGASLPMPGSPRGRGPSMATEQWSTGIFGPGMGSSGGIGGVGNSPNDASFTGNTGLTPLMAGIRRGPSSYFSRAQAMSIQANSREYDTWASSVREGTQMTWSPPVPQWGPGAQQQQLSPQQLQHLHRDYQQQSQQQQDGTGRGQPLAEGAERRAKSHQHNLQPQTTSELSLSEPEDPSNSSGNSE